MSPIQVPGDTGWSCSSSPGPQAKGCVRRAGGGSLLTGSPNSPWPSRSKAEEQDLQVEGDGEGQASTEEGRRGAAHLPGGSAPPHPPHPPRSPPPSLADLAMPTSPVPHSLHPSPQGAPPYSG